MENALSGPVLIIAELTGNGVSSASLEMISAGAHIARELERDLVVGAVGSSDTGVGHLTLLDGVSQVVTAVDPALEPYNPGSWTAAVSSVARAVEPVAIVVPGSIAGRDYAPRVAARLGAPLASDAIDVSVDNMGVVATRLVLGGRVQTSVRCEPGVMSMVTIQPGIFPVASPGGNNAPVEAVEIVTEAVDTLAQVVDVRTHVAEGKRLADAQRIVSGGRGLQKAENFSLIEELAALLDAAVGSSGAAVGQGWRDHEDQVGSTGYTVSPKLYLAVGISGAPQHLVGMRGSEHIVAINRDPNAPIFQVADFGIVGDLFQVVPALVDALKRSE